MAKLGLTQETEHLVRFQTHPDGQYIHIDDVIAWFKRNNIDQLSYEQKEMMHLITKNFIQLKNSKPLEKNG